MCLQSNINDFMMRQILFICCFLAALGSSTNAYASRDEVHYIETSDICRLYFM